MRSFDYPRWAVIGNDLCCRNLSILNLSYTQERNEGCSSFVAGDMESLVEATSGVVGALVSATSTLTKRSTNLIKLLIGDNEKLSADDEDMALGETFCTPLGKMVATNWRLGIGYRSIRDEVLLFPAMKPQDEPSSKEG
ncbi:lysine--tRNA ligase [Striga asiatica]|uniref:Lysine--tRNA ligase n=1 Tax=Striga asiatica TaxID=4170 RepID=A0A5A7PT56_STRAF|nr:lysine--tRNA ligase [Striga asiatica]